MTKYKDKRERRNLKGGLPRKAFDALPFRLKLKARLIEGEEKIVGRIPRTHAKIARLNYIAMVMQIRRENANRKDAAANSDTGHGPIRIVESDGVDDRVGGEAAS